MRKPEGSQTENLKKRRKIADAIRCRQQWKVEEARMRHEVHENDRRISDLERRVDQLLGEALDSTTQGSRHAFRRNADMPRDERPSWFGDAF